MQVQGNNQQTAVTWSSQTKISKQVTGGLADVSVGSCVSVRGDAPVANATVTATNVDIAAGDMCAARTPNAGSTRTPNPNRTPPAGAGPAGNSFLLGTVKSVSDAGFVLTPTGHGQTTGDDTVNTSATTAFTKQANGTAADIATGQCVNALGNTDATGAITATSLTISAPVNGSCQNGMGRNRG